MIAISEHVKETIVDGSASRPSACGRSPGIDLERLHPDDEPREPFLLYPANGWPQRTTGGCWKHSP